MKCNRVFPIGFCFESQDKILFKGGRAITPSVLRPKQITKSCHEHHVYVIMHVIEGGEKFLVA